MQRRTQTLNKYLKCHLILLSRILLNSFVVMGFFLKWKHSVRVPWEFPNQRPWRNRQSLRTQSDVTQVQIITSSLIPASQGEAVTPANETVHPWGYSWKNHWAAIPGQTCLFFKLVTRGKFSRRMMGTPDVTEDRETTAKVVHSSSYLAVSIEGEL